MKNIEEALAAFRWARQPTTALALLSVEVHRAKGAVGGRPGTGGKKPSTRP